MINKSFPSALHWEWHDGFEEHWLWNGQVFTNYAVRPIEQDNGWYVSVFADYGNPGGINDEQGIPRDVAVRYETLIAAQLACEDFFELENGEFPIILKI